MVKNKKIWYAPNKFESYGEEEIKAVEQCLRDGWLAGFGPKSKPISKRDIVILHSIQLINKHL